MIILDIPQRSEEWHAFREGKISGSKAKDYSNGRYISKAELVKFARSKGYVFPATLTIPRIRELMTQDELDELDYTVQLNDSIYKLIAEKIAKPINANDYEDRLDGRKFTAASRGEVLEDEALEAISKRLGKEITPGRVWQSDVNPEIICSPDGEIEVDGQIKEAVEIKCLYSPLIVKAYYENRYPLEFDAQVIQYFLVNEQLEKLYVCLYSDVFAAVPAMELQIFEVARSEVQDEIDRAGRMQEAILSLVNQEVQKLMF